MKEEFIYLRTMVVSVATTSLAVTGRVVVNVTKIVVVTEELEVTLMVEVFVTTGHGVGVSMQEHAVLW